MLLINLKEENGWLISRWNLTYKTGWKQICKAINSVFDYYNNAEILANGILIDITDKNQILKIKESLSLTIRGMSTIIGVPIMITFFNQTNNINVNVAETTEEFKNSNYQKLNMSLGQYMDSIEIAMYK